MKLRSFFSVLMVTVAILLSLGVVGFYGLTAHNPLKLLNAGGQSSPAAAMFVPKQAPAMVSLLVNPDRLADFRVAIAKPGERRRARAELEQLKDKLLTPRGINYEQDIQPWLGEEITLAVTTPDLDRQDINGGQPGYLLAMATRNPARSREFLQVFWQKQAVAGVDLVFEQYSGVKIIYGNPSNLDKANTFNTASAVVGDRFVLFANEPKVLRDAINNVQAPDLSLSRSPAYQAALKTLPDRQIGSVFVGLPALGAWLGGSQFDLADLPTTDSALHLYESLVTAIELNPQGLVAETALLTAPSRSLTTAEPALKKPVEALQFIPAISSIVASGTDLRQVWQQLSTEVSDYSILSELVERPLASIAGQIQSDPVELVSWVDREFALGLLPTAIKDKPDWIFVAERSPDTESAIEQFNAIAQKQGLSLGPLTLNDQPIYAWTKLSTSSNRNRAPALQAEVQAVHTHVNDYEIFATSVAALDQALNAATDSLLTNSKFQQAIAPLDPANDGYLYIDWQSVRALAGQRFPLLRLAEVVAKPVLDHVRSLTVSSYGSQSNIRRGSIFIQLQNT